MTKPAQKKFGAGTALVPVLISALALSGCITTDGGKPKSTVDPAQMTIGAGDTGNPIAAAAYWGGQYEQNAGDPNVAAKYGAALRAIDSHPQALTVLSGAANRNPDHEDVMAEYGKALVAAGEASKAVPVLVKAAALNPGDWRLLMVQGVAFDQQGQHADAQRKYRAALELSPENPSVLTNMGLSQTLAGNLAEAERTLRNATSMPSAGAKARQNLALVLSLQGNFDEAARLAKADLPAAIVNNNIEYVRSMLVQPALWKQMEQLDAPVDTSIQ